MKYDLIFYIAKNTDLGEEVTHSLRLCRLAVIVGGLHSLEDDNLATVLSRVFSIAGISLNNMRKLSCESGAEGYLIRYKTQMILALPDDPDNIEQLLSEDVLNYLKEKLS